MPAPRRKRLPTDFFDRLLSNQTDDQINELLTSLVDEQISPTLDKPQEEAAVPVASAQKKRPKEFYRDKIEDSIITRDESLEENISTVNEEPVQDDIIPLTARMQAAGIGVKPAEKPRPAGGTDAETGKIPPPAAKAPPAPEMRPGRGAATIEPPKPPVTQERPAAIPGLEEAAAAFDLANAANLEKHPDTSMPVIDLTDTIPPAPPGVDVHESTSRVTSAPPPGVHGAPAGPVKTPAPEAGQAMQPPAPPAPLAEPQPAEEAEKVMPLPTHKELYIAKRKAHWQHPPRPPKRPKLAKPTPPVSFKRPMELVKGLLTEEDGKAAQYRWNRLSAVALYFLLPAFIGFSLFSWYPMIKGLIISFYNFSTTGASVYVGLANYARAFHDEMFWRTLLHAAGFCLMVLGLGFGLPIFLAIFIQELRWGKGGLKFLFFLPFLMPTVPAAILWKWIMDQGYGLVNALLSWLPLADPHIGWLTNPNLALFSIALMYIWKNTGWAILIYSAALDNVDETLYEEAEIHGATLWAKIWHVTLPAMRGVVAVMLIITFINTLQIFTEVYIITNGGPMNATEVIATYIYKQAFFYMDIGYASALSILLLLMLLVITTFRLRRLEAQGE